MKKRDNSNEDSDLNDLLDGKKKQSYEEKKKLLASPSNTNNNNNNDYGRGGQQNQQQQVFAPPSSFLCGICNYISAYCSYICMYYPSLCACSCIILVIFIMLIFANMILNPMGEYGFIKNDWTHIESKYDIDIGKIESWCLAGNDEKFNNKDCRCEDPLSPVPRTEYKSWVQAHNANRKRIELYKDPLHSLDLDVVFFGEDVIEEMDGRWMGKEPNDELRTIRSIFKKHFDATLGGKIQGIAMGIAGDTINNALWRLINGEMPEYLNPKVWWLSLGANDLARMQCSEEVVVIGILRIVEEIMNRKPNAHIVINSILPMSDLRGNGKNKEPTENEYKDAFIKYKGKGLGKKRKRVGEFKVPPPRLPPAPQQQSSATTTANDNKNKNKYAGRREQGNLLRQRNLVYSEEQQELMQRAKENKNKKYGKSNNNNGVTTVSQAAHSPPYSNKKKNKNQIDIGPKEITSFYKLSKLEREQQFRERIQEKKFKNDKFNPTLNMNEHYKKKRSNVLSKIIRRNKNKTRLPLWTSIYSINAELRKFADNHKDRVTYFDATPIFTEKLDGSRHILLSEFISHRGHPTELGYNKWEDKITTQLSSILEKMKQDESVTDYVFLRDDDDFWDEDYNDIDYDNDFDYEYLDDDEFGKKQAQDDTDDDYGTDIFATTPTKDTNNNFMENNIKQYENKDMQSNNKIDRFSNINVQNRAVGSGVKNPTSNSIKQNEAGTSTSGGGGTSFTTSTNNESVESIFDGDNNNDDDFDEFVKEEGDAGNGDDDGEFYENDAKNEDNDDDQLGEEDE